MTASTIYYGPINVLLAKFKRCTDGQYTVNWLRCSRFQQATILYLSHKIHELCCNLQWAFWKLYIYNDKNFICERITHIGKNYRNSWCSRWPWEYTKVNKTCNFIATYDNRLEKQTNPIPSPDSHNIYANIRSRCITRHFYMLRGVIVNSLEFSWKS